MSQNVSNIIVKNNQRRIDKSLDTGKKQLINSRDMLSKFSNVLECHGYADTLEHDKFCQLADELTDIIFQLECLNTTSWMAHEDVITSDICNGKEEE